MKLFVWQKAHEFVKMVYRLSEKFPKHELFGVTSQLRRSATSIPTNIAEGCGKNTDPEFRKYLNIAFGSGCEAEYLLLLAFDLTYLSEKEYQTALEAIMETKRMLSSLTRKLTRR